MSALDDLLSDFNSNAGTMPAVNPPEAAKVLATQTAPEVAGEPEPEVVDVAPPPPTEKPAEVLAAEAAKTRKPRQPRATTAPKPAPAPAAPVGGDGGIYLESATTEEIVDVLRDRGYHVTLGSA
jgi:hypothetical protein